MWMGGNVPLGYDVKDRKLIVNPAEAETVRMIFRRYAELGSVRLLAEELAGLAIVSKRRQGAGVVLAGGNRFSRGALYTLLQNPIYRGEIGHQGKVYPGQHEAIVEAEHWKLVQDKLAGNRQARALGATAEEPSLLAGLIVDCDGQRMTPTHAVKKGRRYRYYVSTALITEARSLHGKGLRVPAGDVEALVLDRIRAFFSSEQNVGETLSIVGLDAATLRSSLKRAEELTHGWAALPSIKIRELVRSIVERVCVRVDEVLVSLNRNEIARILVGEATRELSREQHETTELRAEAKLRRAGKGIRLIVGGGRSAKPDRQMIALLRNAYTTREALMSGRDATIDALAQRLGVKRDYLSAHMRVTYLAPGIIKDLFEGRQPEALTAAGLVSLCKDLPHDWQLQRAVLGFETR
jgi:hypothetical protein